MSRPPCYHSAMYILSPKNRSAGAKALRAVSLLLVLSLPVAIPAAYSQSAGGALYEVEIVVFRTSSVSAGEDWSAVPTARGFGNESTRGGAPQVVRLLTSSDYKLNAVETSLRGSGAWRPIAHAAWVQSAANWGTHVGIALSDLGINTPGLSGMVYLERATYLHLGFNLSLSAGATYSIDEMRSVKYNEKQYFDHPAFGVIALVSPVQRAAATAAH
jgi:hypothetical protein